MIYLAKAVSLLVAAEVGVIVVVVDNIVGVVDFVVLVVVEESTIQV